MTIEIISEFWIKIQNFYRTYELILSVTHDNDTTITESSVNSKEDIFKVKNNDVYLKNYRI